LDGRSCPVVIDQFQEAVEKLGEFMQEHNLVREPQEVYNLKGDAARIAFVKNFKEVQRLKTQLDQYTDLDEQQQEKIEKILPKETLQEFRSSYLETAKQLRDIQQKQGEDAPDDIQQLDFEFVLFASAVIDYDYIMSLIADSTQKKPSKQKMTKPQVISLLKSNANLMDEEEDLSDYIEQVDWTTGQTAEELKQNFESYKVDKYDKELAAIANTHGLQTADLKTFVEKIMSRMIFDGEKLTDLMEPLELGWKERSKAETALMNDLVPLLKKQAGEREISGLNAYTV
jgi:type I restriction enzyme R subunit